MAFQCRFCLDNDSAKNMLRPCACRGSIKFVHSQCLLDYYRVNPVRGLSCGMCKEEYTLQYSYAPEHVPTYQEYLQMGVNPPLAFIAIYNWLLLTIHASMFPSFSPNHMVLCFIGQGLFHGAYAVKFYTLIRTLENPKRYWLQWRTPYRIGLVLCHAVCLLSMFKTLWLHGIAADVLVFLYFFEHIDILHELNQKNDFRFTNRPAVRRRPRID